MSNNKWTLHIKISTKTVQENSTYMAVHTQLRLMALHIKISTKTVQEKSSTYMAVHTAKTNGIAHQDINKFLKTATTNDIAHQDIINKFLLKRGRRQESEYYGNTHS